MKKDTALLVVYFGPIPSFINLFLKGCEYNGNVDFWFFTDWDSAKLQLPANVHNVPFTWQKFNDLATKKCGIEINISSGYKLCDLKPAWPHILEDYMTGYCYVGYCDIDLIFGRINHFFTEKVKKSSDIFTITTEYMSGALTVFRNVPEILRLYQHANGWEYIFQDSRHFAFDEYLRINEIIGGGKLQSFSDLVLRLTDVKLYNKSYIGYEKRPGLVIFDHGCVYAENEEWIFFHYVVAKQTVFWTLPDWNTVPDKFFINKYGFFSVGQREVHFMDLLFKHGYRRQLIAALKKKFKTIKRLVKGMAVKQVFEAIIKQFK